MRSKSFTPRLLLTLAMLTFGAANIATSASASRHEHSSSTTYPTLSDIKQYLETASQSNNAPNFQTSIPPLSQDNSAVDPKNRTQCFSAAGVIPSNPTSTCGFGDKSAKQIIFLFGDSQVAQWIPAFDVIGSTLHYKVVYLAKPECPPWAPYYPNSGNNCSSFQSSVIALANKWKPAYIFPVGLETTAANQLGWSDIRSAFKSTIHALKPSGAKIILLGSIVHSTPGLDPTTCPTIHPTNVQVCERTPLENASTTIREVASDNHLTFVDIIPLLCTTTICPIYAADASGGNHLIYFNYSHIDRQYAEWLSGALQQLIEPYLSASAPIPDPWLPEATLTASVSKSSFKAGTYVPVSVKGGSGIGAISLSVTGANCVVKYLSVTGPAGTTCSVTAKKAQSYAYDTATSAPISVVFTSGK